MDIGGVISETDTIQTGIAGGEISYTPDIVTDVYSNTLLLLYLDDLPGSRLFRDDSGNNIATVCTSASCPTAGVPGRFGKAIQFTGASNQTLQALRPRRSIRQPIRPYASFKTSCSNCGSASVRTLNGATFNTDRQIYLSGGNVCVDVFNGSRETICSAGVNYSDNQWHMVAQMVGADGHKLYVDGKLAASGIKTASGLRRRHQHRSWRSRSQATGTQLHRPAGRSQGLPGRADAGAGRWSVQVVGPGDGHADRRAAS